MDYEIIRYIIIGAVVLGVTMFLLKSFAKAAIAALVIVMLFKIGWVYTGEDIENSSFLNNILHPDFIESVVEKYDNFAKKRDELGNVIDPEALEDAVVDGVKDKVNGYLEGDTKIEATDDQNANDDSEENQDNN